MVAEISRPDCGRYIVFRSRLFRMRVRKPVITSRVCEIADRRKIENRSLVERGLRRLVAVIYDRKSNRYTAFCDHGNRVRTVDCGNGFMQFFYVGIAFQNGFFGLYRRVGGRIFYADFIYFRLS